MDVSNLAPGEHLVQCPYNVSHMILNKKQITHLDKCRKQYEKDELAKGRKPEIIPCRFNFSHRVLKPEIRIHESQCPDQYAVLHSLVTGSGATSNDAEARRPRSQQQQAFEGSGDNEDWDAVDSEGGQRGYDPSIKLQAGAYHYMKPGMTKSERNAAREENRKKWLEMEARAEAAAVTATYEEWNEDD